MRGLMALGGARSMTETRKALFPLTLKSTQMLITDTYRDLNARQHFERPEWGRQSIKWWETIKNLCDQMGVKKLLDYGCGKAMLRDALTPFGYEVTCYDPAFPEHANSPEPHLFVVCTDVLEHVEPECLDAVLKDLARVTRKGLFLVVATRPANRALVDGSNPHRIVEPIEWWIGKLEAYFDIGHVQSSGDKVFAVMVSPK